MNISLPFHLSKSSVRGRFVRLESLPREILGRHDYPSIINAYLAELIPLALALAGVFKFQGIFTLQAQGGGGSPVKFMVVDVDSEGHVRACANFDEEKVANLSTTSLMNLFGEGYIAYTIDQGDHTERYQGIVEMKGNSFSECLQHYFRQSEQLETSFYVTSNENYMSACLMIQKLPFNPETDPDDYDGWFTANALLSTIKKDEALGENTMEEVLHRLFWQEGLSVHASQRFSFKCRCSQEKIIFVLKTLPEEDIEAITKDGKITVTCDYCSESYQFIPPLT